ncbi:hypothetical protein EDD86DRAFT_187346 [Gorgonomyces haynaldii]|nr:hypothetical protein EDD86DRAFT_187346 [Gorgonomyces haynaldii]
MKSRFPPTFYCCYLLESQKGGFYVGSTPDPHRRLRQHNGEIMGGAKRTMSKRPWSMVMIIYGFPSKLSALQFEWAWQNPHLSRHLDKTKTKRHHKVDIALELLETDHFHRWPLKIHFTSDHIRGRFIQKSKGKIESSFGPLSEISVPQVDAVEIEHFDCILCQKPVNVEGKEWLSCPKCQYLTHLFCLSASFLSGRPDELVPKHGECNKCQYKGHWGEWIEICKLRHAPDTPSKPTKSPTKGPPSKTSQVSPTKVHLKRTVSKQTEALFKDRKHSKLATIEIDSSDETDLEQPSPIFKKLVIGNQLYISSDSESVITISDDDVCKSTSLLSL